MNEVVRVVDRWKAEAAKAGKTIARVVAAYEAGRDGFWIARELTERGIEAHVMQPASIPVERKGRRAKTDRIDLDMLLRTLLAWLRGEPRVCTMVRVPSLEEEDARRPGRERDKLVRERVGLENQVQSLLCVHGIGDFRPRLKKAAEKLEALRARSGQALPPQTMAQLRRLMKRVGMVSEQIAEIDAARVAEVEAPDPDRGIGMIRLLVAIWSRAGDGDTAGSRSVQPPVPRSARDRGVRRPDRHPVPERRHGARAGHLQERQHARALPVAATDVALVAVSARQRAEPLVLRPRRRRQGANPQGHGGGARAEIAGGAVAFLETGVIPEGVRMVEAA